MQMMFPSNPQYAVDLDVLESPEGGTVPTRMSNPHRNQMQSAQDVPARKVAVNVQKASSFRSRRIDCWEPELHKAFLQKGPGHVYLELQYRSTDKFLPSILQTPECSGALHVGEF